MRHFLFTIAVTVLSRLIQWHDRYISKLRFSSAGKTGVSVHHITSGRNVLNAVLVQPTESEAKHALLICHGIGETVEYWSTAQRILAEYGVASLVFNYSGYGKSSGRIHALQCERDAEAAFAYMQKQLPGVPASLLGFSMGTGIAASIATDVNPEKLFLCAGYTTFREAACSIGWPKVLRGMAPNIWDTRAALRTLHTPVTIVHAENDQLFPVSMAEELRRVCASPCKLVVVPQITHAAPLFRAADVYWPMIANLLAD